LVNPRVPLFFSQPPTQQQRLPSAGPRRHQLRRTAALQVDARVAAVLSTRRPEEYGKEESVASTGSGQRLTGEGGHVEEAAERWRSG